MQHVALSNQRDTCIRLNTPVESLRLEMQSEDPALKWKVATSKNETIAADAICLAVPAYVAALLLSHVDAVLAAELSEISYSSTATINLAYNRADIQHPLDGFGFVVPFIEKRSLMACTFSSVKFARRAPADQALLRAFAGGALQPDMFELGEGEIVRRVREDLRELLGIERPPLFVLVEKWPRSMPQYQVGHLERVKRIEQCVAALAGLELAGNAYGGPGISACVRSGEAAADRIIKLISG
jgi:oxygen-dependent protoporphyrinogen oxidase